MESIQELRVMLQTNVLGHPILQRVLSIYLTRPLLATKVTPNQVTAFMLLLGAAASAAIFAGYFLTGLIIIYLNVLFDAVDGEVARYKKIFSLRGIYLDLVNHLLTGALFFMAVAYFVSGLPGTPSLPVLIAGMLGALSMTIRRANGDLHRVMFVRNFRELEARLGPVKHHPSPAAPAHDHGHDHGHGHHHTGKHQSLVRRVREWLYELHELAPMTIVLFLAYMAELFLLPTLPGHPVLSLVVIFYALTSCAYLVKEIFGGFNLLESRLSALREWFTAHE